MSKVHDWLLCKCDDDACGLSHETSGHFSWVGVRAASGTGLLLNATHMTGSVGPGRLRADFVNPFLEAASEVLLAELGEDPERGPISLQPSTSTTLDVTVVIGVTGQVTGIVLLGLDEATACAMAGRMIGTPFQAFDDLAESGISELGNVIVGRATTLLALSGYSSAVTPPTLIVGRGTRISTLSYQRLLIPLQTSLGALMIEVALKTVAVAD